MRIRNPNSRSDLSLVYGTLAGSLAPLVVVNVAWFLLGLPLWMTKGQGVQEMNLHLLGWMTVPIPIAALVGILLSRPQGAGMSRVIRVFPFWVAASICSYFLLFHLVMWLGYLDLQIIDLVAGVGLAVVLAILRLRHHRVMEPDPASDFPT